MARMDGDRPTLHIRCGSDICHGLREAGFGGDFLEYSDPICQGPVPGPPDFDLPPLRARFLADAYGDFFGRTADQYLADLRDAERRLAAAADYPRVVLWFEHDSYDQLVLARCLAGFAAIRSPERLELICIDRHPDIPHFIGLGQLSAPALAALWPARQPVSQAQIALGADVWAALRQPDPSGLAAIAAGGTPDLPLMAAALHRHLQELPSVADGLSLTQRLVLDIVAVAPATIGDVFAALTQGREPLPFLGDVMLLPIVEQLALTTPPVVTISENPAAPGQPFGRTVAATETGRQVLAQAADLLSLQPPERWIGGVRMAAGQPAWRRRADGGIVAPPGTPPCAP